MPSICGLRSWADPSGHDPTHEPLVELDAHGHTTRPHDNAQNGTDHSSKSAHAATASVCPRQRGPTCSGRQGRHVSLGRLRAHRKRVGTVVGASLYRRVPSEVGAQRHTHQGAPRGLRGRQHPPVGLLRPNAGVRDPARLHGFLLGHLLDLGGACDVSSRSPW